LRRANKLDGVKFYQVIKVDPGQSHVIARLTNQAPLLLEKQVGEGRVVLFTSTFDNIGTICRCTLAFVSFVEGTARYLGGQQIVPPMSRWIPTSSCVRPKNAARYRRHRADGTHPLSLKDATTPRPSK